MRLQESMYQAGLVGCGGAGFPTHVKYGGDAIETIIINGAECEPLLQTDQYLMRNFSERLVKTADTLRAETKAERCVIALKKSYRRECDALAEAVRKTGAAVELFFLEGFFPAGDEQTLVYEVTGKVIPPSRIPMAVGCVVTNVATLYGIADAIEGKAFTEKFLTVTGEVRNPVVAKVPVGTPVSQVLELAGGALIEDYILVNGGPMMGKVIERSEEAETYVGKTMSGILVLPADSAVKRRAQISVAHMLNLAKSACIQCRFCTDLCPRALLGHPLKPNRIMRKFSSGKPIGEMLSDSDIRSAALCCECGVCEIYACPMGLQPRRINTEIKKELAVAGIRWQGEEENWMARTERQGRKVPAKRAAWRAGVGAYTGIRAEEFRSLTDGAVKRVRLALRQGIGAPSVPCIKDGDAVRTGELIAGCPEGKLGSCLHASISGIAKVTESYIEILA